MTQTKIVKEISNVLFGDPAMKIYRDALVHKLEISITATILSKATDERVIGSCEAYH